MALWAEKTREMAELAVRTAYTREAQKEEPDGTTLVIIAVREKNLSRAVSIRAVAEGVIAKTV